MIRSVPGGRSYFLQLSSLQCFLLSTRICAVTCQEVGDKQEKQNLYFAAVAPLDGKKCLGSLEKLFEMLGV